MRTWAYLRVSGESQATDDRDGLLRQRLACEAEATRRGLRIERIFQDKGISGTNELANRPALRDLRHVARRGDVVIVEKADRLARDEIVFATIRRDFGKLGVQIIACDAPERNLADESPMQKMITSIIGVIAEYERSVIVGRMLVAKQRKRDAGHRVDGPKPYGVRPGSQGVIQRIYDLRDEGKTLEQIAAALKVEGFKPRGDKWTLSTISRIIRGRKDAKAA